MSMNGTATDVETYKRWRAACFYPKADLPVPDSVLRIGTKSAPDARLIADACSRLLGQPVECTPRPERGTLHHVWRLRGRDGARFVCRSNTAPDWFRDYALRLDGAVTENLSDRIPTVRTKAIDLSRRICDTDLIILTEAPGRPLAAYDGDESQLRPLLFELGRTLARLHRHRVAPRYGLLAIPDIKGDLCGSHNSWESYVCCRLEEHVEICRADHAIDMDQGRRIRAIFGECREIFQLAEASLLHGDPGSHNIFVAGGRISALIDWEDALAGDPVYEIAFWATFHPERRHQALVEGYRLEAVLPADFEVRFWLYYLRAALAKTVVRRRLGLADSPGREPASRRVVKGLDRLERLLVSA